ncbi:MAG: glycosyltransferase, partial [Bacteroidota bacterium]
DPHVHVGRSPLGHRNWALFLYLGRIDSKKAIENLIEALNEAELFLPSDFQLKIAGNAHNPYGIQLVELVRKLDLKHKVKFIGHIEGAAKQKLLASAHFLFMPSHTENFGIVVAEALGQGTPAVASKQTPWSILAAKRAGFWVDNDVKSLADCIDKILRLHPKEYEIICSNTRPLAVQEFDIQQNIHKWQEIYQILGKHRETISSNNSNHIKLSQTK